MATAAAVATATAPAAKRARTDADGRALLPLRIAAHIRSRGDMNFSDADWAGRVAPGLWVESFSIRPLEHFTADDIEYKGLTGSGFETAWLSDDEMCGTKGMAVPLVGFAVRLKPGAATANYDCEYSGYFKSGLIVGPLRNGAPCRSTVANDPLEGIQLRIARRAGTSARAATPARTVKPAPKAKPASKPKAKISKTRAPARAATRAPARAPAGRRKTAARSARRRP